MFLEISGYIYDYSKRYLDLEEINKKLAPDVLSYGEWKDEGDKLSIWVLYIYIFQPYIENEFAKLELYSKSGKKFVYKNPVVPFENVWREFKEITNVLKDAEKKK